MAVNARDHQAMAQPLAGDCGTRSGNQKRPELGGQERSSSFPKPPFEGEGIFYARKLARSKSNHR
jgi:hypothetical protein